MRSARAPTACHSLRAEARRAGVMRPAFAVCDAEHRRRVASDSTISVDDSPDAPRRRRAVCTAIRLVAVRWGSERASNT